MGIRDRFLSQELQSVEKVLGRTFKVRFLKKLYGYYPLIETVVDSQSVRYDWSCIICFTLTNIDVWLYYEIEQHFKCLVFGSFYASVVQRIGQHFSTLFMGVRFPLGAPLSFFLHFRAHISVGREAALQADGRRFDPCWVHQFPLIAQRRAVAVTGKRRNNTSSFTVDQFTPP